MMSRILLLTLIVCATNARADEHDVRAIGAMLQGIEYVPTAKVLLTGRDESRVIDALVTLANDRAQPAFIRARATALLGGFKDARVRVAVESILSDDDESPLVLRAAIRAAARLDQPNFSLIAKQLQHTDLYTREAASMTLARLSAHR
jgi:HEAT repeat protein